LRKDAAIAPPPTKSPLAESNGLAGF